MRTASLFLFSIIAAAPPAAAGSCYWVDHEIWCTSACYVTDRWWDGTREWMRYSCAPAPEAALIAAGVVVVIIALIVGAIASVSSHTHENDIQQIESDIAANKTIEEEMHAAMRKADAHIAAMLDKHRKGNPHG